MNPGLHSLNVGRSPLDAGRCGSSASALRQLLAERFPTAARAADEVLPTGIPAVDTVCGGLPRPGLTELVCSAPTCGGQLFVGALLEHTREQGQRVALVDRGSTFDPASWPVHHLDHLVWVRTQHAAETLTAADLLARDANLGLLIVDLRPAPLAELRRLPATRWYRLQRALEPTRLVSLILTPCPLVPSARLRLTLSRSHPLSAQNQPRPTLRTGLAPEFLRQRSTHLSTG